MSADRTPAREWFDLATDTASVKGLTVADLASKSGVARTTIYGWRDNIGKPQAKPVNAVADVLGISRPHALRLAGIITPAESKPAESNEKYQDPIADVFGEDKAEEFRRRVRARKPREAERLIAQVEDALRPPQSGDGAQREQGARPAPQ